MVAEDQAKGKLPALFAELSQQNSGLTGPEIALAYKAALSDFVSRKTSRAAIAEVSRLLSGSLAARRQELQEQEGLSAHRLSSFY